MSSRSSWRRNVRIPPCGNRIAIMICARNLVCRSMFTCALMSPHITPIKHGIIFTIQILAKILFLFIRWCVEAVVVPCNRRQQVKFSMHADKLAIKAALGSEGCYIPTSASRALEQGALLSPHLASLHFQEVDGFNSGERCYVFRDRYRLSLTTVWTVYNNCPVLLIIINNRGRRAACIFCLVVACLEDRISFHNFTDNVLGQC